MDEDAGGDEGIAVPPNDAKNSQEYVLPGKPTGHLGSSQKEGKVKTCIKCKFDFIAKGKGNHQICPPCKEKSGSPQVRHTTPGTKRNINSVISPSEIQTDDTSKNRRFSVPVQTADEDDILFHLDPDSLKEMNINELIDQVQRVARVARKYQALHQQSLFELNEEKNLFAEYKIAFADNAFKTLIHQKNITETPSVTATPSTIVVDISEEKKEEAFDTQRLDAILGSKSNGPVAETITRKDNKLYLSFKDALESGKAKSILEREPECTKLFSSIAAQPKFFSVVVHHANITDLAHLEEEILLRNSFTGNSIRSIKIIYRSKKDPSFGHVKILFDQARIRDAVISRGKIYADGRRLNAVETDLNKEVRRCYKCQRYGHLAKPCTASITCGRCAGAHDTKDCKSSALKCVNCEKNHRSGDTRCVEQVKAVKRLRAYINQ